MIKTMWVDMDGVLCDFRKQFISMFKECPEIDYPSKGKEKKEYKRRFDEFIMDGHFATLEPMPDFDEAIHFLRSIEDDYEIKLLSSTAQEKYLVERLTLLAVRHLIVLHTHRRLKNFLPLYCLLL